MKQMRSFGMAAISILILAALIVLPVSGADTNVTAAATSGTFVTATTSSSTVTVGNPVTIYGDVRQGNLSAGVQIWIFAGNYVNVTTVPLNAKGEFSETFSTTGLPAATYYIFVQSPGTNGRFEINTPKVSGFTSQVVNTNTGAVIFNFTGTGSVQDAAAAQKLSEALNQQGIDDTYTKLTLQLVVPTTVTTTVATTPAAVATSAPATPVQTTAKSPISPLLAVAGLGIACLAVFEMKRR